MTTTTAPDVIEGIDMDAVPVCENPDGCDRPATHRIVWTCRCDPKLACELCAAYEVIAMAEFVGPEGTECVDCGLVQYARRVSDLIRMEAL